MISHGVAAVKGLVDSFPMFISEEKGGNACSFRCERRRCSPWLVQPGTAVTHLKGRDSSPFYEGGKAVSIPCCGARNRVFRLLFEVTTAGLRGFTQPWFVHTDGGGRAEALCGPVTIGNSYLVNTKRYEG